MEALQVPYSWLRIAPPFTICPHVNKYPQHPRPGAVCPPPVAVAQLAILRLAPGVDLALGGQRQAVLAPRVDGHLPDEDVLDGLQQGGRGDRLGAPDAQATARTVARGVELRGAKGSWLVTMEDMIYPHDTTQTHTQIQIQTHTRLVMWTHFLCHQLIMAAFQ